MYGCTPRTLLEPLVTTCVVSSHVLNGAGDTTTCRVTPCNFIQHMMVSLCWTVQVTLPHAGCHPACSFSTWGCHRVERCRWHYHMLGVILHFHSAHDGVTVLKGAGDTTTCWVSPCIFIQHMMVSPCWTVHVTLPRFWRHPACSMSTWWCHPEFSSHVLKASFSNTGSC